MKQTADRIRELTGLTYELNPHESAGLFREVFEADSIGIELDGRTPTVLDVGANIGMFSALVKRKWPRARIVAVEPVPEVADVFEANFPPSSGVRLVRAAVTPSGDSATVTHFPAYSTFSGIAVDADTVRQNVYRHVSMLADSFHDKEEREDFLLAGRALADERVRPETIEVSCVRLNDLIEQCDHVNLLKIDVEGLEAELLTSLPAGAWARVDHVVLEAYLPADDRERCREALEANGFTITAYPADAADLSPGAVFTASRRPRPRDVA